MADDGNEITRVLAAVSKGEVDAPEELWRLVYAELRDIARAQMNREAPGRTLQPTALVHEAYMKLFGKTGGAFENRRHFFSAAARVMRQIRIDDARKRKRMKRGGNESPGELTDEPAVFAQDPSEVLAVHEALGRLEAFDERKAQLVTLRYFAGLTIDECAVALDVSRRTVINEWKVARAWLYRELGSRD